MQTNPISSRLNRIYISHAHHPVIRVGLNAVSYGAPAAVKDIYGHGTTCVRARFYSEIPGSHAHLADVNLEGWEYKVFDMTARLIRVFDGKCTEPLPPAAQVPEEKDLSLDFRSWTNHFTVAAIANIGLSEDLGFLEQGSDIISSGSMDGKVKKVSFRECREASGTVAYRTIWAYDWFPALKRLSKEGPPHNLEMGEIVAEISIMMNAGSDTTAIALRNVLFFLLKNPRRMARLCEEIDEVIGRDEVVAPYSKVKHLPYLRACLDKSLRMLPPVIFRDSETDAARGNNNSRRLCDQDKSVSISAYVFHHDETVFKNSNRYLPEWWLGEEGKSLRSYFTPFSTGARGCIGQDISYLEQTVLLASLVHRYAFALPSPDWDPPIPETTNLSPGPMPWKTWRRVTPDE
ncbi:cytochrome P450 [Aspergillus recurvatus]